MTKLTLTLGSLKGKTKNYPKLGTRKSCQFSEAEVSWDLKRGEFSEFRGLARACIVQGVGGLPEFFSSSWNPSIFVS